MPDYDPLSSYSSSSSSSAPTIPAPPPPSTPQPPRSSELWAALKLLASPSSIAQVGQIPCARNALLLGIGSGVGVMCIRLFRTSGFAAANWGMGTFVAVSMGSFSICQEKLRKEQQVMRTIQEKFPQRNVRLAKQRAEGRKASRSEQGEEGEGQASSPGAGTGPDTTEKV